MASPTVDALLVRGLDDWVDMSEVVWTVRSSRQAASDQDITAQSLDAIAFLLQEGLAEAGTLEQVGETVEFVAWDLSPTEAAQRVREEWEALGRLPELGEICWLSNTPKGDAAARQVLSGNAST